MLILLRIQISLYPVYVVRDIRVNSWEAFTTFPCSKWNDSPKIHFVFFVLLYHQWASTVSWTGIGVYEKKTFYLNCMPFLSNTNTFVSSIMKNIILTFQTSGTNLSIIRNFTKGFPIGVCFTMIVCNEW